MEHLYQQPSLGERVYQHPSSTVIGDVHIADDVSIWPHVVMRGDVHRIEVGAGTNIQDHSILHVTHASNLNPDGFPCVVGEGITIGHRVTLHGCICESHCFIGMHCLVMDGAVIETGAYLGAGCLVPPGKQLAGGYLYLGQPAKAIRPLTSEEKAFIAYSAEHYQRLKNAYLAAGQGSEALL